MKLYPVKDYRKERWSGFKNFYIYEMLSNDQAPGYPEVGYLAKKQKLTEEDRYWISFIYGCTYCAPTSYYIFTQFPTIQNITESELNQWWKENKSKLLFQSDRLKVKSFNQFPEIILSYKTLTNNNLTEYFNQFKKIKDLKLRYQKLWDSLSNVKHLGRFSLFNLIESIHESTSLKFEPNLELQNAESSRNGLCYACGLDRMVTLHHQPSEIPIDYTLLNYKLEQLQTELKTENPELPVSIFNIETILCAYKKLFWNTRYLGYYIDRNYEELKTMEKSTGKIYNDFWEAREKYIPKFFLAEFGGWNGIRTERSKLLTKFGTVIHPAEHLPEELTCHQK